MLPMNQRASPGGVLSRSTQKYSTVLPWDCLLYEGEGFYIFPRRLEVGSQVQAFRKGVKKYTNQGSKDLQ